MIFVDGTKDKNHNEIISIAARYVLDGKPKETVIDFQTCENLSAEATADVILSTVRALGTARCQRHERM